MARIKVVAIGSTLLLLTAAVTWSALPPRDSEAPALEPTILLPPGAPENSGVAHEPAAVATNPLQGDVGRANPSPSGRTGGSSFSVRSVITYVSESVQSVTTLVAPAKPVAPVTSAIATERLDDAAVDATTSAAPATRWTVVDVPASEVQRLAAPKSRAKGPVASRRDASETGDAPAVDPDADWYGVPEETAAAPAAMARASRTARKPLPVRDAGDATWYDSLGERDRETRDEQGALSSFEDSLLAGMDPIAVLSGKAPAKSTSVAANGVRRSRGGSGVAPETRGLSNPRAKTVAVTDAEPVTRWRLVKLEATTSSANEERTVASRGAKPASVLPSPEEEAAPAVILASLGPKLPGAGATEFPGLAAPRPEATPKPTSFCPVGLVEKKNKSERFCARIDKTGISFREGPVSFLYKNGKKKAQGTYVNGRLEGAYVEYSQSGNKTAEGDLTKGKKNGEWSFWWDDGKKQSQGRFVAGERQGHWIYWDEKGRRLSEGEIRTVGNVEKKQGTWTFFHANGTKKEVGTFDEGKKDGAWKTFDNKGRQVSVLVFRDGEEEIR